MSMSTSKVCSEAELHAFAGTRVERDFVEAPSQMLENWCWEKASLKRMSAHHTTGVALPDDLLDKLIASRSASDGLLNKRQLLFGIFDQTIHSSESADVNTV